MFLTGCVRFNRTVSFIIACDYILLMNPVHSEGQNMLENT